MIALFTNCEKKSHGDIYTMIEICHNVCEKKSHGEHYVKRDKNQQFQIIQ